MQYGVSFTNRRDVVVRAIQTLTLNFIQYSCQKDDAVKRRAYLTSDDLLSCLRLRFRRHDAIHADHLSSVYRPGRPMREGGRGGCDKFRNQILTKMSANRITFLFSENVIYVREIPGKTFIKIEQCHGK